MIPRPGEVSLAHNGVLFLDELPEFPRNVLEVMRQPLEDGTVSIARAAMSLTFPARFMLAAAMNPCPCGYFNDRTRECRCTPQMIQRYVAKVSGPLLDRIDIHIDVPAVNYKELRGGTAPEGSREDPRPRVARTRGAVAALPRSPGEELLQRADGFAADPPLLRTLRRLRTPAGTRHDPAGPQRARPRPHPEGGAHQSPTIEGAPQIEPNTSQKRSSTGRWIGRTGRKNYSELTYASTGENTPWITSATAPPISVLTVRWAMRTFSGSPAKESKNTTYDVRQIANKA
jgi:hypothetical protein